MRIARVLALAALAGCAQDAPAPSDNAVLDTSGFEAPAAVDGENAAFVPVANVADTETADESWIGTWAATPALCAGGRWRFARDRVVTDGETACGIVKAEPGPLRQTRLTLDCQSEGMKTQELWLLDPREDGGMQVTRTTGNAIPIPVTLGRCG